MPDCPDCGEPLVSRRGKFGQFWGCSQFPECKGAFSGVGTPGNAETRALRIQAHAAFDPLWKNRHLTRKCAYARLRYAMGMRGEDCHISRMDAGQCRRVVEIVAQWKDQMGWSI